MHGTYREQTGFHSPLWAHNLLMVQKTAGTGGEKDAESWGGLSAPHVMFCLGNVKFKNKIKLKKKEEQSK